MPAVASTLHGEKFLPTHLRTLANEIPILPNEERTKQCAESTLLGITFWIHGLTRQTVDGGAVV
jgi:hypothetical protein